MSHNNSRTLLLLTAFAALILATGCGSALGRDPRPLTHLTQRTLAAPAQYGLIGDMDNDGEPTVGDAIRILRVVVGLDPDDNRADANCNGSSDVGDAIKVLRCVVGLDDWPIRDTTIAGKLVYHPPTADRKYSYYHYIPQSALNRNPVRILLNAHSSPPWVETYDQMEEYVADTEVNGMKGYCTTCGYAFLCMVTPENRNRVDNDTKMKSQQMSCYVMFDYPWDKPEYEFYKRPDLVMRKTIEEFVAFLAGRGYDPYPRVFMTGFSSGGMASDRFPKLHPDMVAATAPGAAGQYIYPLAQHNGTDLTYPVGVSDIKQIPDTHYSLNAVKQIPHFFFVGESDNDPVADPVPYEDCFTPAQTQAINTYFGTNQVARAQLAADYLASIGMAATCTVYSGVGHSYTPQMHSDTFAFFDAVSTTAR